MANALVKDAAQSRPLTSLTGLQERLFAQVFDSLVYTQIWEDPRIDREALAPLAGRRIAAIASGGCNTLAYLADDPAAILAVDLNPAHLALNRLKHAALRHLPERGPLLRFLAGAADPANPRLYDRFLAEHLDPASRAYWERRDWRGRRRIDWFGTGFWRAGWLGRAIGWAHLVCRLHGVDPRGLTACTTPAEQRLWVERQLLPLIDRPLARFVLDRPLAYQALGIPPAQFQAMRAQGGGMAGVLRERLARLATIAPLAENPFAWQAFARRYPLEEPGALPDYLHATALPVIRERLDRIDLRLENLTVRLRREPPGSVDRFVLLDAQDWMTPRQLAELWAEIRRTATPDAKVICRSAGPLSPVEPALHAGWRYADRESSAWHARDRSAIYGGFHLYVREAAA